MNSVARWIAMMATLVLFSVMSSMPAIPQQVPAGRQVSDGVRYREYSVSAPSGDVIVHMVLIDADAVRQGKLAVGPAMGGELAGQCAKPDSIGDRVGAVAAIDGPYSASAGGRIYPLGFTVFDGRPAALGDLTRPLVGIDSYGRFKVQVAHPKMFVTSDVYFEPVFLWGINEPAIANGVTLYDRKWGASVSPQGGIAIGIGPYRPQTPPVIVVGPTGPERNDWDGIVVERSDSGAVDIPEDGYALVFKGGAVGGAEKYRTGVKTVVYAYGLPSGWEEMRWIATLGPWFVHGGSRRFSEGETSYRGDITGRADRAAIGTTWNDEIFFAVTSGSGLSVGEASDALIACNAREAVMCDSGSSSGLWVRDVGSVGCRRSVPVAFVVKEAKSPAPRTKPIKVWTGRIHGQ